MASTYSTNLRIELMANGEKTNTWGTITNTNLGTLIEQAISGVVSVTHSNAADYTLTANNGSSDEARNMVLEIGGTLTAARNVVCPTADKLYFIRNATSGGFAITLKTAAGAGISVPNGSKKVLYCDGTNVVDAVTDFSSGAMVNGIAIVNLSASQTLTNKTITSPTITTPTISSPTLSGTLAGVVTIPDNIFTIVDNGDPTKAFVFQASGITAGQTRVLTIPDSDFTLVGLTLTQTLTNKTLTSPVINGGTITGAMIENTPIGTVTPAAGAFTTIAASGAVALSETVQIEDDFIRPPIALTHASPTAWNMASGSLFTWLMTSTAALSAPTGEVAGQTGELRITMDGTGNWVPAWDAAYKFPGNVTLRPDPTANAVTCYGYQVRGSDDVLIWKKWTSSQNSIGFFTEYLLDTTLTSSTTYNQAHGLGRYPALVQAFIECTTTDQGYSVGDRVNISSMSAADSGGGGDNSGVTTGMSATNAFVVIGGSNGIELHNKSTQAHDPIDLTDWDLYVRVYE